MVASSKDFWNEAASLIAVTEKHPFLVAMVDGTLPDENFRYYVVQDALYLKDFADSLRRLGRHPDSPSKTDANRLEAFAVGAEEAELSLHKSFFTTWKISTTGVESMPHTLLYTSYMAKIVATRPYAEGLAVLLPCFWVYAHVGEIMLELRKKLGDSVKRSPQFDAWIDMYGGEAFANEVKEYIALVDAACATADDECLAEMSKHFTMGCKLEHMFWSQASDLMQWPKIAEGEQ